MEKVDDFDGGPYKKHFQNWQFDVSLLENIRKKVYLFRKFFHDFHEFFFYNWDLKKNIVKIFEKNGTPFYQIFKKNRVVFRTPIKIAHFYFACL